MTSIRQKCLVMITHACMFQLITTPHSEARPIIYLQSMVMNGLPAKTYRFRRRSQARRQIHNQFSNNPA